MDAPRPDRSATRQDRIAARGRAIFAAIAGEQPSLFDRATWMGRVMEWSMRNERFRVQLLRFVDVFPSLTTGKLLASHLKEYFGDGAEVPAVLAWGARAAGGLGALGGAVIHKAIAANIEEMARQFIVGHTTAEAVRRIGQLRGDGFASVVDVLGEATLSEEEAERYTATTLELVDALGKAQADWHALPPAEGDGARDWGHAPKINVAVKPTALYCLADPRNFEGSVTAILRRLQPIAERVIRARGFLCLDAETYRTKGIVHEVFRRLKLEHRDYPHLGIVLQSYLRETDADLGSLLAWCEQHKFTISVRLVKGAYWDQEVIRARQNGWDVPVWARKAESDAAFERHARKLLERHDVCHLACASHNVRSIAAVAETARELGVPAARYEFQMLYGMAEPVRKAVLKSEGRVRLYCPYGELVPGLSYLVRRLLENTANASFLRQSFAEGTETDKLLADPAADGARAPHPLAPSHPSRPSPQAGREFENDRYWGEGEKAEEAGGIARFRNEPAEEFTRGESRQAFAQSLAEVRSRLGRIYPLVIGGKECRTDELLTSVNPNRPAEAVGRVCMAGPADVHDAMAAAKAAFPAWRDTDFRERAGALRRAAEAARKRHVELAAWQVLEIGKQWEQAHADVGEAIDFLDYYAREMTRLGTPRLASQVPGEVNRYLYEPKGVAAVIAPWNFPLAISMGMAAAALVAGNTVVYKPSELTPCVGWHLVELFREAGLPPGVFNYLPGSGAVIGDVLVDHPDVSLIAFTGSMQTGLRILERAARVHPGQERIKTVVCEMGGKNAIVIDDDADLDEAVPHVLQSAFGFQGQKCSACSRAIVLDTVHDRFVRRLVEMAKALSIGPAEDPAHHVGAVADERAMRKILDYIEVGRREGRVLYQSPVPEGGFYVPVTIVGGIEPHHRLAQDEVFGPVLAVMRARDFDQALAWANATKYALTGGLFSRSPAHIARAQREFRVGNLYVNRGITGAMVERQPFGGVRMSGAGTKAGGQDYLLHFMDPRAVTENTVRRGFAADPE